MKSLTLKRTAVAGRGRLLLGVLAVAWLNLAVQPCLMAMQLSPEPIVGSPHAAHVDHASHSPIHGCDHCPPASSDNPKPCASGTASGCESIPAYNHDGRNGQSKIEDIPTFVAIADLAMPVIFVYPPLPSAFSDCAALKYPNGPSLSIRFCVFLK